MVDPFVAEVKAERPPLNRDRDRPVIKGIGRVTFVGVFGKVHLIPSRRCPSPRIGGKSKIKCPKTEEDQEEKREAFYTFTIHSVFSHYGIVVQFPTGAPVHGEAADDELIIGSVVVGNVPAL